MKTILLTLSFFLIPLSPSHSALYKLSAEKGKVFFYAKGKPSFISINGEGKGVTAELRIKDQMANGEFSFDLQTLKTGIELRDDHLKNTYLEIDKYPTALLKISNLKVPLSLQEEFPFNGNLTLHGVDQPVDGKASVVVTPSSETLFAEFNIKLSQFKIQIPSFQGITVAEEVKIKIEAPVVKEN